MASNPDRIQTFRVVLVAPEIPPNTGNVIRLCANTGASLALVEPLGFSLDDPRLVRAGLDYRDTAPVSTYSSWEALLETLPADRMHAVTTRGERRHDQFEYRPGDVFVFGSESRGLPPGVLSDIPDCRRMRLPMVPGSRSMNLANSVAVVLYEAWRQTGFHGGH